MNNSNVENIFLSDLKQTQNVLKTKSSKLLNEYLLKKNSINEKEKITNEIQEIRNLKSNFLSQYIYNIYQKVTEDFSKYWLSKQSEINKFIKLRFFKTHAAMCKINNNPFTDNKNTLGAIYILRDPRNLITSLSNHYQLNLNESLDFMIQEKKALVDRVDNKFKAFVPIFSWQFHLKSWIQNKSFKTMVIRLSLIHI